MHLVHYLLLVIFVFILTGYVSAKGRIAVQLVSYNNSRGLDIKGQCCDGVNIPGCPVGKCDHVFDICIREPPGIKITTGCVYGNAEINAEENQNVVTFPDGKSLFDFDVWKGGIEIFINVTDTDSGDVNVPVDYFIIDHYTTAAGYNSSSVSYDTFSLMGARNASATELVLKIKVYCDPHYYGTDCSINCVPDNSCSGYYNCDDKGNKVCLPGWTGVNCTGQIAGGVADCSVYGGGDEFVPSLWEGFYVCPDNNQPQLFQLNITRTSGKINLHGQLKINSVALSVAGTYRSLSRGLTLQANSLNGSQIIGSHSVANVELNVNQRNETFMDGKFRYNDASGVICDITTLNRIKAYFSGCNFAGVCIRYGTMKDEFYCCCRQGTIGPYCAPTILLSTNDLKTTSTTSATKPAYIKGNKSSVTSSNPKAALLPCTITTICLIISGT